MPRSSHHTHKFIASAYDAGLGDYKRYIVEARDIEHARQVVAESGLVDADVQPYEDFNRKRVRRTVTLMTISLLLIAGGVSAAVFLPWQDWMGDGDQDAQQIKEGDAWSPPSESDFDQQYPDDRAPDLLPARALDDAPPSRKRP